MHFCLFLSSPFPLPLFLPYSSLPLPLLNYAVCHFLSLLLMCLTRCSGNTSARLPRKEREGTEGGGWATCPRGTTILARRCRRCGGGKRPKGFYRRLVTPIKAGKALSRSLGFPVFRTRNISGEKHSDTFPPPLLTPKVAFELIKPSIGTLQGFVYYYTLLYCTVRQFLLYLYRFTPPTSFPPFPRSPNPTLPPSLPCPLPPSFIPPLLCCSRLV